MSNIEIRNKFEYQNSNKQKNNESDDAILLMF